MSTSNIKKCSFSKCKHEDAVIDIEKEKYVQDGRKFYHEDCYKDKSNIEFMMNFWRERIDQNVNMKQLRAVLNRMIFNSNYPSDYVVFVLQYCVSHGKKLRYPPGIKYYIDDFFVKKAYREEKVKDWDYSAKGVEQAETICNTATTHKRGFGSVFGGAAE